MRESANELDERAQLILRAVVETYITHVGPVGSRFLVKHYGLKYSPATVRNVMADLEDLGYLEQPHTSAGRVPTDKGYRFYVKYLLQKGVGYKESLAYKMQRKLINLIDDMEGLLESTARTLSGISHYISMALAPGPEGTTLRRIEMVPYKENKIAVVILTDEGIIRHHIVENPWGFKEYDLQRICRTINKQFGGLTLKEIREVLLSEMLQNKEEFDILVDRALRLCREVIKDYNANLFIQGIGDIFDLPEFEDIQKIRQIYKTIQDKRNIVRLLDEIINTEGLQVIIGAENPVLEMESLSVVASTFQDRGKPSGVIGIIGPKRMDYESAITLVDTASKVLTRLIEDKRRK